MPIRFYHWLGAAAENIPLIEWMDPRRDERNYSPPARCARCGKLKYLVWSPRDGAYGPLTVRFCEECWRAERGYPIRHTAI